MVDTPRRVATTSIVHWPAVIASDVGVQFQVTFPPSSTVVGPTMTVVAPCVKRIAHVAPGVVRQVDTPWDGMPLAPLSDSEWVLTNVPVGTSGGVGGSGREDAGPVVGGNEVPESPEPPESPGSVDPVPPAEVVTDGDDVVDAFWDPLEPHAPSTRPSETTAASAAPQTCRRRIPRKDMGES